jgi:probable addiction module antidote protein
MKKTDTTYDAWVAERLAKNPQIAAEYLRTLMEDGDAESGAALLRALKQIAQAQGLTKVAKKAGIHRESLSRALSAKGNPRVDTLMTITRAMGLQLTVQPITQ